MTYSYCWLYENVVVVRSPPEIWIRLSRIAELGFQDLKHFNRAWIEGPTSYTFERRLVLDIEVSLQNCPQM